MTGIKKFNTKLFLIGQAALFLIIATTLIISNSSYAVVPGDNSLASTDSLGTQANGNSSNPMLSQDGEFVAFESVATNLVSSDTNSKKDIFLKNIRSGATTRISVSSTGVEANDESYLSSISETGRYIAFKSKATNLIDGQTYAAYHSYLRDTYTNQTSIITVKSNGTALTNTFLTANPTTVSGVSSDGKYILVSALNNSGMVDTFPNVGGTNGRVVLIDRSTNTRQFVDQTLDGTWNYDTASGQVSMSCDGSVIVYSSRANNLVDMTGITSSPNMFMTDFRGGNRTTTMLPIANAVFRPNISCNGNYISYTSSAEGIVSGLPSPNNGRVHFYQYDRINGTTELLDKKTNGTVPTDIGQESAERIHTANSGVAAFTAYSKIGDLGGSVSHYPAYAIIRDPRAGTTLNLAKKSDGGLAVYLSQGVTVNGMSQDAKIAVGVTTDQTALVSGDSNGFSDIVLMKTGL